MRNLKVSVVATCLISLEDIRLQVKGRILETQVSVVITWLIHIEGIRV